MCDDNKQGFEDLKEFLHMLDFQQVNENEVRIVPNYFLIKELPASIQEYLRHYFDYLDSIQ